MLSLESLIKPSIQQCLIAQGKAIAHWEAEIDDIVARLYNLTDAERQIIEVKERK